MQLNIYIQINDIFKLIEFMLINKFKYSSIHSMHQNIELGQTKAAQKQWHC